MSQPLLKQKGLIFIAAFCCLGILYGITWTPLWPHVCVDSAGMAADKCIALKACGRKYFTELPPPKTCKEELEEYKKQPKKTGYPATF